MTRKSNIPAKNVPETVPSQKCDGEFHSFSKAEMEFLQAYSSCYDVDQAFTEARIERRRRSEILDDPYVKAEMVNIQQVWKYHGRMSAGFAAGNHMRLMGKFENEYNKSGRSDKAKFAGTLAKMSEATLKSTGMIGNQHKDDIPTVIINVDGSDNTANVQINHKDSKDE